MPLDARTIFTFLFVELTYANFLSVSKDQLFINNNYDKESNSLHSFRTKLKKNIYMNNISLKIL